MMALDEDPDVKTFLSEGVIIPYIRNKATRVSKYFPDFVVEYTDGRTVMYEIKPSHFLTKRVNIRKWEAAQKFCSDKGWTFEILTEDSLKEIGLLKRKKQSK